MIEKTKSKFGWPDFDEVDIELLPEHPPFDYHTGLTPEDRPWRESLVRQITSGRITVPTGKDCDSPKVRAAIYAVTYRAYHTARILQCFFENENHGNYADPFLESLLILLSWRSRIEDAHEIIRELRKTFSDPLDMLEPSSSDTVREIVSKAGFSQKRPQMVLDLVRQFHEHFPDSNFGIMREWCDEEVISFITSMQGMGYKSALCVIMFSLERKRFPIDAHTRRILRRTQLLQELYKEQGNKEHRQYQREAEKFIPPSVRRPLHVGLVALGQDYCLPREPKCQDCPISDICQHRREFMIDSAERKNLTHIDLFCGAGGFGQGFEHAGYRTVLAADNDEKSTRTYRLNHPSVPSGNVLTLDLESSSITQIRSTTKHWQDQLTCGQVDVITAGIPCQGFSKAGYRTRPSVEYNVLRDPRNHLYKIVVRWTRLLEPQYVVIENVTGMRSAGEDEENILRSLESAFRDLKYNADHGIVNAEDFGVAQVRHRLILIASHPQAAEIKIDELSAFHGDSNNLINAIDHLPPVEADGGKWYTAIDGKVITGHRARYNNAQDLKIFGAINPGERYVDFVERRNDIIKAREESDRAVYSTESFPDKFFKLHPDRPARTIVAHLQRDGNGYIHPNQTRSITPREAACIQGFDDEFVFTGTQGSQFIQIGNAIPPPMANAIARLLASKLEENPE
jgi:DNA (cytosine-5)-methyltransferase 1